MRNLHSIDLEGTRTHIVNPLVDSGLRCMLLADQGEPERELKEVFSVFDTNGSGNITPDELRAAIKVSLGFFRYRVSVFFWF